MSKRRYTKIDKYGEQITKMQEQGYSRREIATALGLEFEQVKNWISRRNKKERNLAKGITSRPQGRPPKQSELEQLRMENKLLRDFLQFAERM